MKILKDLSKLYNKYTFHPIVNDDEYDISLLLKDINGLASNMSHVAVYFIK